MNAKRAAGLAVALLGTSGCLLEPVDGYFTRMPASAGSPETTVCDPFGQSGGTLNARSGLAGDLVYFPGGNPGTTSVDDFLAQGTPVNVNLFFTQLNVPSRDFTSGFSVQSGPTLSASDGSTLVEWFALHFRSTLKLGDADPEGDYQLALLSDDGSWLKADEGSGMRTLVDNDGLHQPRVACATGKLSLSRGERIPIELAYYQGPRQKIALMLLWRKIATGGSLSDAACGQNRELLTSSMQSSGWRVVSGENLQLLDSAPANPCGN